MYAERGARLGGGMLGEPAYAGSDGDEVFGLQGGQGSPHGVAGYAELFAGSRLVR